MALTDNLISFWKLGEVSGTRFDSVGSNDLTDNNTVTQAAGKIGDAAQFTKANSESLTHVDNASLSTGDIDFSFAMWVYLDSKNTQQQYVCKYAGGGQVEYTLFYASSLDRFRWVVSHNGSTEAGITADTFGAVSINTWYFLACWHDSIANTINISVNDGGVDSLAHSLGVFDSTATLQVGAILPAAPINFVDGRMDAIGFWKKVLPANERTELYNSGDGLEYPFTPLPPPIQSRISIAQP